MFGTPRSHPFFRVAAVGVTAAAGLTLSLLGTTVATASPQPAPCVAGQLRASLVEVGGPPASDRDAIRLTEVRSTACRLRGWPSVVLVGHDGAPIGVGAGKDRGGEATAVVVAPHRSAVAPLRVRLATAFPAGICMPVPAEGFRVTPPGEHASLFVAADGVTGCAARSVSLLTVSAFRA